MLVFLFSDIEGSTVRWESKPEAMSHALQRHDEVLRAAMSAHGGRVFKTVGDAFCVVFDAVDDALRGAVRAQRDLLEEDWSGVEGLHVRMAVHAGEAIERDGDYFGPAVNRVARLLATAHGDQIIVSQAAASAATSPAFALRALGTFRLKDLERPEHIYQVLAEGLPSDFKPLQTLDAIPNNLPIQGSAFVGRTADAAAIRAKLRGARILTIAGPGGVGKTRIALQCAADRMDRMTDGVWFVNLAPLTDPALVPATVLSAMGARDAQDRNPLDALVDHTKNKTMLIVLDNCEHVIEQAARCASAISAQAPHVTILATSREALHVEGEAIYRLSPLDTSDAVSLFAVRAQAVSSRFEVTSQNRGAVEAICARLDGIPLAIELAAARTVALSPQQLAERLDRRFALLTSGTRTALPRQQTLQALIDWSHDLLTETEKILFRRLSVFRGSFTLESASLVCADDALDELTIVDLLTSLADKSLVVTEIDAERPRYHLLESIREYALSKLETEGLARPRYHLLESIREYATGKLLEAGEGEQLRLCHAEYFAQRARIAYGQFDTQPPPGWLDELRPDLDNFRATLEWTLRGEHVRVLGVETTANIGPVFLRLSLLNEGIAWCERARAADGDAPPAIRARLRYVLSMLYNNQARYALARPCAREAVHLYRTAADERGLVRALSQLAHFGAREVIDEAISRARSLDDARLKASVLRRCAFALPAAEIETARSQFIEALHALEAIADDDEACLVRQWWAEAEASAGEYARAIDLSAEAAACADRDTRMYLACNSAGYAYAAGDFSRAARYATEALALALEDGHELLSALALAYVAPIVCSKNPGDAARLFGFARKQLESLQWSGYPSDRIAFENLERYLRTPAANDYDEAFLEGKKLSRDRALAIARRLSTLEHPSSGVRPGS